VSYKRTLVFLAVFAALAVFFYFYEIKGGEERRRLEEHEELLLEFTPEQATELVLNRAGSDPIVVEQDGDAWRIASPVSAPAEQDAISEMLDRAATLKFERDVGAQSDLKPFGLSEPELALEIAGEQGSFGELLLGAETPDGSNLYVKLSNKDSVFTANRSIKSALDKTVFDLRSKRVVTVSPAGVTGLAIAREGKLLAFEKPEGEAWSMTFPDEYRADAGKINGLLNSIKNGQVEKFVEEEASDLEKYGLASPTTRIELNLVNEVAVLYFGDSTGPDETDNVFARRGDRPQVIELSSDLLDNVSMDVNGWRDRSMIDFDRKAVVKLQVVAGEQSTTVERSGKDVRDWRVTEPEPAEANRVQIEDIITYLSSTKVERFIPPDESDAARRALETPAARVKIWEEGNAIPLTLSLGEAAEEGEVFATNDREGEYSIVHAGLLEELVRDPEKLSERFNDKTVIEFVMSDINKIGIQKREKSYSIERDKLDWVFPDEFDFEKREIDGFLWALQQLEYKSATPREHADSFYGFDNPTMAITLRIAKTDEEKILTVGKSVPERESIYVLGDDENVVMEINGELAAEWLEKF
jgi:hypothetical protein